MAKTIELRRHTDNDGDVLSEEGVRAALEIGAALSGDYQLGVSTGAQRATQTVACMLVAGGARVPGGVIVEPALRSDDEDRWREIAGEAEGKDVAAFRQVDREFVEGEAETLAEGLRRVFAALDDGGRALVVGHSPTNEAAVLGLTGQVVEPMGKGGGVVIEADGDGYSVKPIS